MSRYFYFQYQAKTEPVLADSTPPPEIITEDKWHFPWSEPVRFRRMLTGDIEAVFFPPVQPPPPPDPGNMAWFAQFSEPLYPKSGLSARLQMFFTWPPRHLPTPDVTVTMAATEVDTDVFLGAINVYDATSSTTSGAGARVSIEEVSPSGTDPWSARES